MNVSHLKDEKHMYIITSKFQPIANITSVTICNVKLVQLDLVTSGTPEECNLPFWPVLHLKRVWELPSQLLRKLDLPDDTYDDMWLVMHALMLIMAVAELGYLIRPLPWSPYIKVLIYTASLINLLPSPGTAGKLSNPNHNHDLHLP